MLYQYIFRICHEGNITDYADCYTNICADSKKEAIAKFKKISDRKIYSVYCIKKVF